MLFCTGEQEVLSGHVNLFISQVALPWLTGFLCTSTPQALNQLFEKIIALDIDERHLLRMGHGEEALETEKDFSR